MNKCKHCERLDEHIQDLSFENLKLINETLKLRNEITYYQQFYRKALKRIKDLEKERNL